MWANENPALHCPLQCNGVTTTIVSAKRFCKSSPPVPKNLIQAYLCARKKHNLFQLNSNFFAYFYRFLSSNFSLKEAVDRLFVDLLISNPELSAYKSDGPVRKLEMISERRREDARCPRTQGSSLETCSEVPPSRTPSLKSQRYRTRKQTILQQQRESFQVYVEYSSIDNDS